VKRDSVPPAPAEGTFRPILTPSRGRRFLAALVILLETFLLLIVAGVAGFGLGGAPAPTMFLTIFTGGASIQRLGAAAGLAAHTGDGLLDGDLVTTGAGGRAAILYPDGSVTRLDVESTVKVRSRRTAAGTVQTSFEQSAGLTWNRVQRLVGLASFKVSGPNSSSAEVRGTTFGYYIEHEASGRPVVWVDVYSGSVRVNGTGPSVLAGSGQRVTVRAAAPPTTPAPIPAADSRLSFTVFNQALDALSGIPIAFSTGVLSTGGVSPSAVVKADGKNDLQLILAWPGSIFELTVTDPAGHVYARPSASVPPLSLVLPQAQTGSWTFSVRDVQSPPQETWWVVVARR
jgi:hypothetical protein